MEIEVCCKCNQKYEVREVNHRQKLGHRLPEPIRCPKCGHTYNWYSWGWFETRKLR